MAIYNIKTANGEEFQLDPYNAEIGFKSIGYDFYECVRDYVNDHYTAWGIANDPTIDEHYLVKEFIHSIIDGNNPDFTPIGGDRNGRTYLTVRKHFPDMYVDEEEDYWIASRTEDFITLIKKGLCLLPFSVSKTNICLHTELDGMYIGVYLEYLPAHMPIEFKKAYKDKDVKALEKIFNDLRLLDPQRSSDCYIIFDVGNH